jgi:regulator of sigma E protease
MSLIFLTIIAFIVTIGFLVVIHEGGHFAAARLFGVWVHQFAVGMGPAIWRRKGRETEYSIRIFPIGGYVRMAGEDRESPEDQAVPKERLFTSKPAWQRMIIVFAGR